MKLKNNKKRNTSFPYEVLIKEDTKDVNGSSFKSGREYEFKITSTGGAEITGLDYKYDTLESQI